jgi:plasmid stabilization system protein ParE
MPVIWAEPAVDQLQAIRDGSARISPFYGQALAERIVRKTEFLEAMPLFGAEVLEYADESIRELFEAPFRILYRVSGPDVQIIALVHAARMLPRTPPE